MSPSAALQAVLVAWLVLVVPLLGRRRYRALLVHAANDTGYRVGFYRRSIARQWTLALLVGLLLAIRAEPAARVGLAFRSHQLADVVPTLLGVVALVAVSVLVLRMQGRRRPSAPLAERLFRPVAALLPRSGPERRLFALVAFTAGVTEEFVYRGFLVGWLTLPPARLSFSSALVVSAIAFAAAHAYQGWPGVLGTGLAGFALASLYAVSGSLLAPMLVHVLVDLRVLWLVPRREPPAELPRG
jgi:membrane protease YdiL (CAAX protease family)